MGEVRVKSGKAFSLLEMLVASLIMVLLVGASINLLRAGLGTSSATVAQGVVQDQARAGAETLARELKDTGVECTGWAVGANPDPVSQYYGQEVNQISFSRCVGYDPALEMLQWGPVVTYQWEPPAGDEPGKLLRTEGGTKIIVCSYVSQFVACYEPDDSVMVITLTVTHPYPGQPGHFVRASYATAVKLRN
ncbi:MAG: hypothetical protein AMS16_05155 [Planctomycetes bacterium DG_58]|nr:MAG: hypothetical protein AMS16_05155 [Planctomycetes bacterium DG_58]